MSRLSSISGIALASIEYEQLKTSGGGTKWHYHLFDMPLYGTNIIANEHCSFTTQLVKHIISVGVELNRTTISKTISEISALYHNNIAKFYTFGSFVNVLRAVFF